VSIKNVATTCVIKVKRKIKIGFGNCKKAKNVFDLIEKKIQLSGALVCEIIELARWSQ